MNRFLFRIKVEGSPQTATLRLASKVEIQRYHRSLSPFARQSTTAVREAVEFTRLAAKRWRCYSRSDEAVENFANLQREIRRASTCEVAFIMIAITWRKNREVPVGLAYCRRTWCHHPALDFLALHPRALSRSWRVSGAGSGIVFGLVQEVSKCSRHDSPRLHHDAFSGGKELSPACQTKQNQARRTFY